MATGEIGGQWSEGPCRQCTGHRPCVDVHDGSGGRALYVSDRTASSSTNGWGPVERDLSNNDAAAGDGLPLTLDGVIYAKELGAHAPSDLRYALNGACTLLTANIGVDDEVGANGSIVFQVWTDGVQRFDSGVMTGATATRSVYVSVAGATELALILTNGGDGADFDHGDWADAQLSCAADTAPPTVTVTSPLNAATGVALNANVTATFSEAITAATVTTSTVTLVPQGSTTPLAATVTYAAGTNTVTLDPIASLVANTQYTATIKGGASGVKDVAGNALAADRVWTFKTDAPPTATISQPLSTFKFKVGDVINYSGSATDPEDGTIAAANLSWDIVLHHCPSGACHLHPFTSSTGASGMFTVPDHGDETYFEIILTAVDSAGQQGATAVNIQPLTVRLTLDTSPTGLQVVYGGTGATAPATYTTTVGSTHTIFAQSPQNGSSFTNWSDNGAQQHNIVMGMTDATYVAAFGPPDTTAPTVTTVNPANGATGVVSGANVSATFSEAMNASTVTTATVTLVPQGSSTPVAATVAYDGATRTVTLDPTANLAASTLYTATVKSGSGGVKDLVGNALAADRVWTFTTAAAPDTTPPTVTATVPASGATGVVVGANVTATFSEAMNATTLTTATVTLVAQGSTTPLPAVVTYDSATHIVTLDPTANLVANTLYTATVKSGASGAKDIAGNALAADRVWTFTTAVADTTTPTVTDTTPASGATGVATGVNVTATFSEAMNASTLTTATVTLVPQGSISPVAATVSYDAATRVVTLDSDGQPGGEHALHRLGQGRRVGREGPSRERAGCRWLDLHHRCGRELGLVPERSHRHVVDEWLGSR